MNPRSNFTIVFDYSTMLKEKYVEGHKSCHLKNVGFETVLEPNLDNFVLNVIDEDMLLALIMLAF